MNQTASAPILTTDGIPLKVSLKKVERKNKIRAFLLVLPLLAFILVTFLVPIADMLARSIDDRQINTVFPKTFEVYKKWDRKDLLLLIRFGGLIMELKFTKDLVLGKVANNS